MKPNFKFANKALSNCGLEFKHIHNDIQSKTITQLPAKDRMYVCLMLEGLQNQTHMVVPEPCGKVLFRR